MNHSKRFITACVLLLLPACGGGGDSSSAEACARVVQQVRGVPGPVKVVEAVETASGQIEIAYDYVDAEKLTVAGSAICTFAVGGPGSPLELVDAIVDEKPVDATAVAAANRMLSGR